MSKWLPETIESRYLRDVLSHRLTYRDVVRLSKEASLLGMSVADYYDNMGAVKAPVIPTTPAPEPVPVTYRDWFQDMICKLFHVRSIKFHDEAGDYRRCLDCGRRIGTTT